MKRVLIIGAYGNFGSYISRVLASDGNIQIIIAGRSFKKANIFSKTIDARNKPEIVAIDINENFDISLASLKPDIVIHTSGPFQTQDYHVAETCIAQGCHYIDLSDGRDFVSGISKLDQKAKAKSVMVISGASSVPCLTSALVDHYKNNFKMLEKLDYGITTAQKTNRGLATTTAILSYTGRQFKTLIRGEMKGVYGWQDLHARKYPELGWRLLGNCDVPDLTLFPDRYPELKSIRFFAGLEISFIHLGLWFISWLVRLRVLRQLEKYAGLLLRISYLFDFIGSDNSAFHMQMTGTDREGSEKKIIFDLIARSGDGPYIPCMPVILMAKKIANDEMMDWGASPCIGFITLEEYLGALESMDIHWHTTEA